MEISSIKQLPFLVSWIVVKIVPWKPYRPSLTYVCLLVDEIFLQIFQVLCPQISCLWFHRWCREPRFNFQCIIYSPIFLLREGQISSKYNIILNTFYNCECLLNSVNNIKSISIKGAMKVRIPSLPTKRPYLICFSIFFYTKPGKPVPCQINFLHIHKTISLNSPLEMLKIP